MGRRFSDTNGVAGVGGASKEASANSTRVSEGRGLPLVAWGEGERRGEGECRGEGDGRGEAPTNWNWVPRDGDVVLAAAAAGRLSPACGDAPAPATAPADGDEDMEGDGADMEGEEEDVEGDDGGDALVGEALRFDGAAGDGEMRLEGDGSGGDGDGDGDGDGEGDVMLFGLGLGLTACSALRCWPAASWKLLDPPGRLCV